MVYAEHWDRAVFQNKMLQIVLAKVMKSQRKTEGDCRGFFSMLSQTKPLAFKLGALRDTWTITSLPSTQLSCFWDGC